MSIPRLRRDDPLEVVRHLVTAIGSRRATSLGEAQAAAYVDSRLRRAGLSVSADTFNAASSLGFTYPLLALLGILAALLALWITLPALILALYGLMLAVSDALATPLPSLARQRASQNIVAARACEGAEDPRAPLPRWRVVLLAPLDSPLHDSRLAFFVGRHSFPLVGRIAAFALLVVLLLLVLLDERSLWRYGLLLPSGYLLLTLLPAQMLPTRRTALLGGAGALAALLATMERLNRQRSVELWAVALGATATGHSGLHDFLARYPFPREDTLFLVLQNLDGDRLAYAPREGALRQYRADPQLIQLVAALQQSDERLIMEEHPYTSAFSIASVLHSRGYRALTLFAHQPTRSSGSQNDVLDTFNDHLLEQSIRLITAVLRQLDSADYADSAAGRQQDAAPPQEQQL
jgi:hypothetical protein